MDERRAVANTIAEQIGKLRLSALNLWNVDWRPTGKGGVDTEVDFAIGSKTAKKIRKVVVTYRRGADHYEVASFEGHLQWNHGTELVWEPRYSSGDEGIYCDQLGDLVMHAAREAGARPRIA